MSKIVLTAKLFASDGKADELRTSISASIEASSEEPGLPVYSAAEDR